MMLKSTRFLLSSFTSSFRPTFYSTASRKNLPKQLSPIKLDSVYPSKPAAVIFPRLLQEFQETGKVRNNTKFVNSLRNTRDFPLFRSFLQPHVISKLNPLDIFECARCLVELKIVEQWTSSDMKLAQQLNDRFQQVRCPEIMHKSIEFLLNVLLESNRALNDFHSYEKPLLNKKDLATVMAMHALINDNFEAFGKIVYSRQLDVTDPLLMYWLCKYAESSKTSRTTCGEWWLQTLADLDISLSIHSFDLYSQLLNFLQFDIIEENVSSKGVLTDGSTLPGAKLFDNEKLEVMKNEMKNLLESLSIKGGSVEPKELQTLQQVLKRWKDGQKYKRTGDSAVVVDTLNVTCGTGDFTNFNDLINQLAQDYGNVLLITRNFVFKRIFKEKYAGNVKILNCSKQSEDDLFVLFAALNWGNKCHIFSNDQFHLHIDRLRNAGFAGMDQWLKKVQVQFVRDHYGGYKYVPIPSFERKVQRIGHKFFFPVVRTKSDTDFVDYLYYSCVTRK